MGEKAKPRWAEYGFPDEAQGFALRDEQAAELWTLISLDDAQLQSALQSKLNAIAGAHRERLELEKTRPALREQNAALKEILDAAHALETKLREVDHVSQDELVIALDAAPLQVEGRPEPEHGFSQYENLRYRLEAFTRALAPHLECLKAHRGPPVQRIPKKFIFEVAEAYEQVTGKRLTHTAHNEGTYKGRVQSQAGTFIWAFVQMVDSTIKESAVCSVLASYVLRAPTQHLKQ